MRFFFSLLALVTWSLVPHQAGAVGTDSPNELPCGADTPCTIDGGEYYLMFPPDWDGDSPLPAMIYYHGHRSSGASVFRAGSLKEDFSKNGYLIIAPNGAKRPGSDVRAWPARPAKGDQRDDVAFSLAVIDDVSSKVPLDNNRLYASGFSAGGSMAWMMACYAGDRFAGFASVAGALRRPNPEQICPGGPVKLLQVHGFADKQVPFEGRGIRDWHQGDLHESFSLMRATNQCRSNPDEIDVGEKFRCRTWGQSCENGALRMCIHDGGHGLPKGWTGLAREWFEKR
ncbi:MAG: PHB depolymerase family esterase [Stappiaceae bacterium]